MGKIFNALEKYRKERTGSSFKKLQRSDLEVLKKFDPITGKINIQDPDIVRDKSSISRLITYGLIHANASLTPAGKAKVAELTPRLDPQQTQRPMSAKQVRKEAPSKQKEAELPATLTASDWAMLMNYDPKTGNLLKYDPATDQLEESSRAILKDPDIIQRLIDRKMISPGGWLTPKAITECSRLREKLAAKNAERQEKPEPLKVKTKNEKLQKPKVPISSEHLERLAAQALLHHNSETQKLDMSHPAIVNHPEVLKYLLEHRLIEGDGKLTPKALIRYGASEQLKKEPIAAKPESGKTRVAPIIESPTVTTDPLKEKIPKEVEEIKAKERGVGAAEKIDRKKTAPAKASEAAGDGSSDEKPFSLFTKGAAVDEDRIDQNLISLLNPDSFEAEQFKILRTNLLFPVSRQVPRSVMVTSAVPGEGKSFVAANLAVSVARHVNWNVLLIDCDLRRPSVHRQFGFDDVAGLSNYLTNGATLPSLLLKTGVERLSILPAGKPPDNPSELLSSERMAEMLKEVTARYADRLIIIDTPPPMMTAESSAIARQVDGVLVVVKHASTPQKEVTDLIDRLGKDKILGAIVNNFEMRASRYYRKYYNKRY